MFGRFTERAQRVIVLSQEEARRLGHSVVGTEHILLGLIAEGEDVAARSLLSMGISIDQVRRGGEIIGRGGQPTQGQIGLRRAQACLELAFDEARRLGHTYIGTEHLLLGLIRKVRRAAQVLTNLGADLEKVRAQVTSQLGSGGQGKTQARARRRPQPWTSLAVT